MTSNAFPERAYPEEDALADLSERIGTEIEKEADRQPEKANRGKDKADRGIYGGSIEAGIEGSEVRVARLGRIDHGCG